MAGQPTDLDRDIAYLKEHKPDYTEQDLAVFCDEAEVYVDCGMSNEAARLAALGEL